MAVYKITELIKSDIFSMRIMWELYLAYKKHITLRCPGRTLDFWMYTAIMCIKVPVLICGEQITVTPSLDLTRSLI